MNKTTSVLIFLALVFCVTLASCPFNARFNVTWDPVSLRWAINDDVQPMLEVVGSKVNIFNITDSAGGDFFISSTRFCNETHNALGRKNNVTNNACTPPCTIAFNLTAGHYFYCSSRFSDTSGYIHVVDCDSLNIYRCNSVIGCSKSESDKKCHSCSDASSEDSCNELSACKWCPGDEICLHKDSNACRAQIELDRFMPSWVWFVIAVCALIVLIAVFLTLFLSERSFHERWSALSKMDKDFAEVGKGANDGLSATD